MTLRAILNFVGSLNRELAFYDDSNIEIINANTCAHYHKNDKGQITLGGDVIDVTEDWVLDLSVVHITTRDNHLIILIDG